MLLGERNANDGDEQQYTEEKEHQAGPETAKDNPYQVQRDANAADGTICIFHLRPERPEAQQTDLESLQRHGNTDDRDGQGQASREITDGGLQAPEEPPQ